MDDTPPILDDTRCQSDELDTMVADNIKGRLGHGGDTVRSFLYLLIFLGGLQSKY